MESHEWGSQFHLSGMTLAQAKVFADKIARAYRLNEKLPRVYAKRMGKHFYTGWQQDRALTVNTDKAKWTPILMAHEMAHYIVVHKFGHLEPHGPLWLGVYAAILDRYSLIPAEAMRSMKRKYGLRMRNPELCSPSKLRKKDVIP